MTHIRKIKEKKILLFFAIFMLVLCVFIALITIKEVSKKNEAERNAIGNKMSSYMYFLRINGEIEVKKDKIVITNMEQNETRLRLEVVLFNTFYPEYVTTYDELMNSFYSFCHTMTESKELEIYSDGIGDLYDYIPGTRYSDYENKVFVCLEEKGIAFEDASEEELEEASKQVAQDLYNSSSLNK